MKGRTIKVIGIIIIIFGVLSTVGVGVAYYLTKPIIDGLPSNIEQVFSVATGTVDDTHDAIKNSVLLLRDAADKADFTILWVYKPLGSIEDSLNSIISSVEKIEEDVIFYKNQMELIKTSMLSQIDQIRLVINGIFIFLIIQYMIFILIGLSLCMM